MFRRKELPPELAAAEDSFHAVLDQLEPAKAALADVLPTTRMPGRPLHDALEEFDQRLAASAERMPAWRRTELEPEWLACDAGLDRARDLARAARGDPGGPEGFEALLGLVTSLLDPLEPFADAEVRFRRLRR